MERRDVRYAHAEGHTCVLYSGNDDELLTCGSDGDIRVWSNLEDDDPSSFSVGEWALAINTIDKQLLVSNDSLSIQRYILPQFDKNGIVSRFTAPITHIAISNKASVLVCGSENMEAKILSIKEEDSIQRKNLMHEGPVLGISICPHDKFCCTSSGDGFCRIWNIEDQTLIKEINCLPKVNSFYSAKVLGRSSFEPLNGKILAYPNNKEVVLIDVRTWQQKYSLTHPDIKTPISQCLFSPCGKYLAASTTSGQIAIWNINSISIIGITEHPSLYNISSLAWNPKGNGELAFCDVTGQLGTVINCYEKVIEPNTEDDNLDLMETIEREIDEGEVQSYERVESDDENENAISLNKLKNETLRGDLLDDDASEPPIRRSRSRSPSREKRISPQAPFQPSATPLHLEHRYMCWNEVGIVKCHTTDTENSIEVEFHDTSTHHSIHMNNHLNHTMAALSYSVLVLACETPSKMVCVALKGASKEWSVSMGDLEEIICITATETLVAAATSMRYLRLYTSLGTQLHVICMNGPVVSLTGREGILNIVYHNGEPNAFDQNLAMDIIHMKNDKFRLIASSIHMCLSESSTLRWFGSTESGAAVTLDSKGILRLYKISSRIWVPICDTQSFAKGASDTYYVVSVSTNVEKVHVILCRGTPFPLTAPRPTVTQLPLSLPFCEMDSEKSQLEEQLRRMDMFNDDVNSNSRIEIALKLFALACRSDIEQRAEEIISVVNERKAFSLAARYAARLGKLHLADKLSNLDQEYQDNNVTRNSIIAQEVEELEETQETDVSIIIPHQSKHQKETVEPLKPAPLPKLLSQNKRNPFKKSLDQINTKTSSEKPLSLTDRTLVDNQNNVPSSTQILFNVLPEETFLQWYNRNKENLQTEHSNMETEELAKYVMKLFKEQKQIKRKLSPEPKTDDTDKILPSVHKQSKLSSFSFQKRNV